MDYYYLLKCHVNILAMAVVVSPGVFDVLGRNFKLYKYILPFKE